MALQAVVAAAGPGGMTRDRIIGILWPESGEDQARHRLSQTLYLLRRETGSTWITGTARLRLERTDSSDVTQFYEALEAGQLERAAMLYTGPFIDGFYLSGAPEFEAWVEETRARLHASALKALGILARQATDAGSPAEAVVWWRRLCTLEPFHGAFAVEHVRSHIALGEMAIALRVARAYESRVRHELETEPDPALRRLIAELLATPQAPVIPLEPKPAPTAPDALAAPVLREPNQAGTVSPAVSAVSPASAVSRAASAVSPAASIGQKSVRSRLRGRAAVAAALLAAIALVPVTWRIRVVSQPGERPLLAIGTLQPRASTGSGTVLRDMLATNLARVGGLQVVANSRLVELLAREAGTTSTATADAARRAGADEIVEGELDGTEGGFILTLRRVALRTGVVLQGYTVRAADLYALTDSATAAIAADFGLDAPPDAVAGVRTGSAVAYALYEQGLRAYYHGDSPATIRLMSAALERDSAFAMAAAYLWRSNWEANRPDDAARLVPMVRRLASRAQERERLWIEGMLAWPGAPLHELLGIARELARRFPEDPDGQLLLGRALFGAGDFAGAVAAFDRAIAIDSVSGATDGALCRVCAALSDMSNVWMWWDSLPAAERSMRRLIAFRPDEGTGWSGLVESLLREGRRSDAESAAARATRLSAQPIVFDFYLDRDLVRSGRLDELVARLVPALRNIVPEARGQMPWLLAIALRNQGRLREARELALSGQLPDSPVRLEGHTDVVSAAIIALENSQPGEAASRFLRFVEADRSSAEQPGVKARSLSWHMTLAGTALAAAGDTAAVLALADSVERIGQGSNFGRDFTLHHFLRGLVHQHGERHVEAVDAFRRSLFSMTDGYTRINLELARSLLARGRNAEAIAVLQPALRGGIDGGNTYVTHTELHEALARAFDAAGQVDSAAVHWSAVERAWRYADAGFAERYRYAAARVPSFQ
jgi:DNA-binding SARP family transcriptional activator/TolB-like protein